MNIKYFLCDVCNGSGKVFNASDTFKKHNVLCPKCRGKTRLDWIENITGAKKRKSRSYTVQSNCGENLTINDLGVVLAPNQIIDLAYYFPSSELFTSNDLRELMDLEYVELVYYE